MNYLQRVLSRSYADISQIKDSKKDFDSPILKVKESKNGYIDENSNKSRDSKGIKKLWRQMSRDSYDVRVTKENRDTRDVAINNENNQPKGFKKFIKQLSRDNLDVSVAKERRPSRESGDTNHEKQQPKGFKKFLKQLSRDSLDVNCTKERKPSRDSVDVSERRPSRDSTGKRRHFRKMPSRESVEKRNAERKSSRSSVDSRCSPESQLILTSPKKRLDVLYDGMPYTIQEKARIELNETEDNILKGMTKLKAYVKKENWPLLDDIVLMACLRVAKYDMKKAQDKLKRFYNMRYRMAEMFERHLDLDICRKLVQHYKCTCVLPYRDEEGRAIFRSRGVEWSHEICEFDTYACTVMSVYFFALSIPISTVSGVKYLCDLEAKGYNEYYAYFKGFKSFSSNLLTVPCRIYVDAVNDNTLCRWLYSSVIAPLLPSKISKRVRMHGYNRDSLHESIDFSLLPDEYGGTGGPINNDFMIEQYMEFLTKFKEQNKLFLKRRSH